MPISEKASQAIAEATKELIASNSAAGEASSEEQSTPTAAPIDVYQNRQDTQYRTRDVKTMRGASPMVMLAVKAISDTVEPKYREYKANKNYFKEKGDMTKVDMLRHQYMMETFLPALEAVVNQTSPDEVLNSQEALEVFDEWASVPGSERGFTEGYIKQAYGDLLGGIEGRSDGIVTETVGRIRLLADKGQNRAAKGLAEDLVKAIQRGENVASEADFALLNRVANFE